MLELGHHATKEKSKLGIQSKHICLKQQFFFSFIRDAKADVNWESLLGIHVQKAKICFS